MKLLIEAIKTFAISTIAIFACYAIGKMIYPNDDVKPWLVVTAIGLAWREIYKHIQPDNSDDEEGDDK